MLDLFYLAVGCMVLLVFWAFVKASTSCRKTKMHNIVAVIT